MTSPAPEPKALFVGGSVFDSTAHLVLYAADIDLDAVTAAIGCPPTSAHLRGQSVGRRPPAPIGLWSLESPRDLGLEAKIRYLLASTTADTYVWRQLSQSHDVQLRCAIFLRSWTEGLELSPAVLADLGTRGWRLSLAMYSAEGDEVMEAFLSGERLPGPKAPQ